MAGHEDFCSKRIKGFRQNLAFASLENETHSQKESGFLPKNEKC